MNREYSAGGIVLNNGKVLMIKNAALRDPEKAYWGFPKGHIQEREKSEEAAVREIREETGIEAEIVRKLGVSRYVFTKNSEKVFKVVVYFMLKYISGEIKPQDLEVLEVKWVSKDEALDVLSFKKDKDFLQKALGMNDERITNNQFVSRGGIKLQAALDQFKINPSGKTVLDVGSSTGGFVDCLLQNGAQKVYAVDTAYGELAWKLRQDSRVVVMERTNILHLTNLPAVSQNDDRKVDIVTIDAGWTRLELILPVVRKFLKPDGKIIALLKPQYEAEKKDLVKGVLREGEAERVKDEVVKKIKDLEFEISEEIKSPILGGGGNTEYLLLLKVTD